jgi:hypothetical protein
VYFPAHSKPIEEVEEDLISGKIIISGNKFVDFTDKFKYLGTYLAQNLSDDTDVDDRITAASKNFNALGKELFRNRKISLHIQCRLFCCHCHQHPPLGMQYLLGHHPYPTQQN